VSDVFHGHAQRYLYRPQEESEMAAYRRMGKTPLFSIIINRVLISFAIILKGMQFFNFIFLERSWASDRQQLASQLSVLGKQAEQQDKPLSFIIYPEGTLISENTRPISKKFADKMGIVRCASSCLMFQLTSISSTRWT